MAVPPQNNLANNRSQDSLDTAEKGLCDNSLECVAPPPFVYVGQSKELRIDTKVLRLSPASPVHQGITPFSSVPELSLQWPPGRRPTDANKLETVEKKPPTPAQKPKPKISRWVLLDLWFNTYRKFFTFVTLLNLTGIILASLGRFPYAENHLGALVLGNLLCAIMVRNELFMRFLYMVAIYGLRSVRPPSPASVLYLMPFSGPHYGSNMQQLLSCSTSEASIRGARFLVLGESSFRDTAYARILIVRSWLVYKIVDIIRYRAVQHPGVIATGIITNVFIIISVLSAFPWVRKWVSPDWTIELGLKDHSTYHNVFEKHHRFVGWLGLAVCMSSPLRHLLC